LLWWQQRAVWNEENQMPLASRERRLDNARICATRQSTFKNGLDTALSNADSSIGNAFAVEPYGADYSEYDIFLGYTNYAPNYSSCQ
jgi:hypothetical protein